MLVVLAVVHARAVLCQVIEALIANRLTAPRPLVRVADWARQWAVEEIFGLSPDTLNDDRVGRALDAIAPAVEGIVGSVGAAAISAFGLDVARLPWDMTSCSVYGDTTRWRKDSWLPAMAIRRTAAQS